MDVTIHNLRVNVRTTAYAQTLRNLFVTDQGFLRGRLA